MPEAVSNTSPLLYLYRVGALEWLPRLFSEVWIPPAVVLELEEGRRKGCDVPDSGDYAWLRIVEPRAVPSEWLAVDLGAGELAAMRLLHKPRRHLSPSNAWQNDALNHRQAHGFCGRHHIVQQPTMALALENPDRVVLLDDALARRIAQAAGLAVWGTLKVLLEAKAEGLTASLEPLIERLKDAGMWISDDIRRRVLALAGEKKE